MRFSRLARADHEVHIRVISVHIGLTGELDGHCSSVGSALPRPGNRQGNQPPGIGSVRTVGNKLIALRDMGVGHVLTLQNFGLLPQRHIHTSMERLMREVVPCVNQCIGERVLA